VFFALFYRRNGGPLPGIDILSFLGRLGLFMATMLTNVSAVGTTAANTACRPTAGNLEAFLKNSKVLLYCVPNEHICAEIGRFLGLPIPPSGLVYKQGNDPEHFFASLNFNLCKSQLPPIDPARCAAELEFETAGVILFDILIANNDRHQNNLSVDTSQNPPKLTVFDHSHALFGDTNGVGRTRLITLREKLGIIEQGRRHCLLSAIKRDFFFREWIDRIKGLPNYLIDQACDATVPLNMITAGEALAAKDFLKYRKSEIETIIKAHKLEFTAISQWSLLQ
jgi:hypothetical protein